jgi:DNA adenine methylase
MALPRVTASSLLQPPLKWAGGKRWLVPRLQHLWQPHQRRRLVEPFVGGLAVALGLAPRRALLNDTNPHLINFYHWLQHGLVIDLEMRNERELFYAQRQRFNDLVRAGAHKSREAAALFYYLNRTCFNGLCRFNNRGAYNVPFGRYRTINYTRDFRPYRRALSRWEFRSGDFVAIELDPGDLIYADPPYDVEFTAYTAGGFGWDDQVRLAEWLAAHRGPVIASNQATDRILDLYSRLGFQITILEAPRMIACNGDRRPALEILATRNL